MRLRRLHLAVRAVGASLLAVLAFAAVPAGAAHRAPLLPRAAVPTFAVPVRACPTATAYHWRRGPRIPRTRRVAVPAAIAAQVALYVDQYSVTAVLGPRGWGCRAAYGPEGDGFLFVYAPGERAPGPFLSLWPPRRSAARELVVASNSSCLACVLAQACPYFAHARHLLHRWGYWSAAAARTCRVPRGERVAALAPALVSVVDPPGVLGDDTPSGGADAALGEAAYVPVRGAVGQTESFVMTCTLPSRDHALCYASLHWFARGLDRGRRAPLTRRGGP